LPLISPKVMIPLRFAFSSAMAVERRYDRKVFVCVRPASAIKRKSEMTAA